MEWLVSLISSILGLLLGGGGVLFYKQNRAAKVIENESNLVKEWEKLYKEEKSKREINSEKLEKLSLEVAELKGMVEILKADKINLMHYKCTNIDCDKRQPPMEKK